MRSSYQKRSHARSHKLCVYLEDCTTGYGAEKKKKKKREPPPRYSQSAVLRNNRHLMLNLDQILLHLVKTGKFKAIWYRENFPSHAMPKGCSQSKTALLYTQSERGYVRLILSLITHAVLILFHYSFLSASFPQDWDRNCFALVVESSVERKRSPRVLATLSDFSTNTN